MPRKAFLKKKSLLDRFKDDYATHTGYIQSARAKHTWNNPLTRRKRTKELNRWIKSFAGKDHIHKLARFNAINAGKNEDYADGVKCLRYGSSFELPDGKIITALDKAIRCRRSGAFIVYITGWVENEENDPCNSKYIVYFDTGKYEDYFLTNDIQDLPNYQTNGPIPSDNKVVKDYAMHENTNEAMSLKGFLENLTEKLTKQFDLDLEEVQAYLNSHTQEMQELLDDKELSLKEKVLFVRSEITGEKDEAKESADEKLGYEKGHKNSRGEDAPWVIRSHEDNRILASFANKKDAEEHLKRMKQYSKNESLETYACYIDFATEDDAKKGMEIVKGWHPFKTDTAVLIDSLGEDAANHLWNDWKRKCAKAGLAISDEGEVYKEEPTCFYGNESKKSESAEIKDKQYYLDMFDKAYKECVQLDIDDGGDGQNWANYFATGDGDPTTFSQKKADEIVGYYMEFHPNWEGETDRPYKDWMENINNTPKTALDKEITRILKALYAPNESKKSESKNLSGYTSDIISELDVIWACGLDGAKRLADKYADVIQQNYVDGDLLASETAKFIAGQENLTESRKKTESKQSEVHLELIDTITVPKWLWEAHTFGNEYGEELDEHEQEILAKFEEEYGKQYYLDDRSEEADFRSRNDFDEYGGPCYEVDVYKMS